MFLGTRVKT